MSWQNNVIQIIRVLIDDTDYDSYTYTDERLEKMFIVSAYTLISEVDFSQTYTITISTNGISPDPETDIDFINLACLKSACMIYQSEYKTAANCAVTVKDGLSSISYGPVAQNLKALAESMCKQYEDYKNRYQYSLSVGQSILGPYSPGSDLLGRGSDHRSGGGYFQ